MTTTGALEWLSKYQPLPSDDVISEKQLHTYDEIRRHFLQNSDARCIPLLLNSFGGRNGFGVYQLIGDVLQLYPFEEVIPCLLQSLRSPYTHVRQWSADVSLNFSIPLLVSPLANLLADEDVDVRAAAIIALTWIKDERVPSILKLYLEVETDDFLRELILEE